MYENQEFVMHTKLTIKTLVESRMRSENSSIFSSPMMTEFASKSISCVML